MNETGLSTSGINDFIMGLVYGGVIEKSADMFEAQKQGQTIWLSKQIEDEKLEACLLFALKESYSYNNQQFSESIIVAFESIFIEVDDFNCLTSMLDIYLNNSQTDPRFAQYVLEIHDTCAKDHGLQIFRPYAEKLCEKSKSDVLAEGFDGCVAFEVPSSDKKPEYAPEYIDETYRAKTPAQSRYIFIIEKNLVYMGSYGTSGYLGYKQTATVKVIDKLTGEVIANEKLEGLDPPQWIYETDKKSSKSHRIIGSWSDSKITDYIEEQIASLM